MVQDQTTCAQADMPWAAVETRKVDVAPTPVELGSALGMPAAAV